MMVLIHYIIFTTVGNSARSSFFFVGKAFRLFPGIPDYSRIHNYSIAVISYKAYNFMADFSVMKIVLNFAFTYAYYIKKCRYV